MLEISLREEDGDDDRRSGSGVQGGRKMDQRQNVASVQAPKIWVSRRSLTLGYDDLTLEHWVSGRLRVGDVDLTQPGNEFLGEFGSFKGLYKHNNVVFFIRPLILEQIR